MATLSIIPSEDSLFKLNLPLMRARLGVSLTCLQLWKAQTLSMPFVVHVGMMVLMDALVPLTIRWQKIVMIGRTSSMLHCIGQPQQKIKDPFDSGNILLHSGTCLYYSGHPQWSSQDFDQGLLK